MIKRIFDIGVASVGLVVISPLLSMLPILIKASSPGPAIYRAKRVGRYGNVFELYKFRTMYIDSDKLGPGLTLAEDERITPIGKFLCKSKIDELPQLFNVLKGDMSLVGPRPESPNYVALYTEQQRRVLNVRPGITSLASLTYRDESQLLQGDNWEEMYIASIMPSKLALDMEYVNSHNMLLDLIILLQTIKAIIRPPSMSTGSHTSDSKRQLHE